MTTNYSPWSHGSCWNRNRNGLAFPVPTLTARDPSFCQEGAASLAPSFGSIPLQPIVRFYMLSYVIQPVLSHRKNLSFSDLHWKKPTVRSEKNADKVPCPSDRLQLPAIKAVPSAHTSARSGLWPYFTSFGLDGNLHKTFVPNNSSPGGLPGQKRTVHGRIRGLQRGSSGLAVTRPTRPSRVVSVLFPSPQ